LAPSRQQEEFSVRARVTACLDDGRPTAADLASKMKLSVRTLQRRLAAEGTSFSALLDEVRRDYTLSALSKKKLTCDELSEKLGYCQQSTFTRAVRRWTGKPPSALLR
jgi:AraC-like DNA-binding protein